MGDDTNLPFNADWIWKLMTLPRIQFFCGNVPIIVLERRIAL